MAALAHNVDALLQAFENRRAGLTTEQLEADAGVAQRYFLEIYDRERERLRSELADAQPHLSEPAKEAFFKEIDGLIKDVVVPAYSRVAVEFTPRERRDFFVVDEPLRLFERVGWAVLGLVLGFIFVRLPLFVGWAKILVVLFVVSGFVYPELRRYLAYRRYASQLDQLVALANRELDRLDRAYLNRGEVIRELQDLGRD